MNANLQTYTIHHSAERFAKLWFLQLVFWSGLCVITFLTLTVWYGHIGWPHTLHTVVQGLIGIALSYPLHTVFSRVWNVEPIKRVVISLVAIAAVAGVWNLFRMVLFIQITGEQEIWDDFGGWYFGAILVILCWATVYHGIRYYQLLQTERIKKLEAEAAASQEKFRRLHAESQAKDAQLKMLRYQLNPHFLFNTLNAINSLVGTTEPRRAQKMIIQLSKFLRYSLDNDPELKIPLEREVDVLLLYLEIEKTRFGDRLHLDFDIELEAKSALIPSLLLQPLIENSMKYAIAKNENGGTIKLHAVRQGGSLKLELSDTGNGGETLTKPEIHSEAGHGIGLKNTVDRLRAFYGDQFVFDIAPTAQGGMQAIIEIPFEVVDKSQAENTV